VAFPWFPELGIEVKRAAPGKKGPESLQAAQPGNEPGVPPTCPDDRVAHVVPAAFPGHRREGLRASSAHSEELALFNARQN